MQDCNQVATRKRLDIRCVWLKPNKYNSLNICACVVMMCCALMTRSVHAGDTSVLPAITYSVGMTQVEYVDPTDGDRPLNYMLIYPTAPGVTGTPFKIFLSSNLNLYKDAPVVSDGLKHPLVVISHGAGGNGSGYAWFGEYLASRGYLVAMVYHYRANTFDSSALYVRNKLWQRPRDVSLDITHLLRDKVWGSHIDPNQIGVAGHSQGGFTALWLGGARVNPDRFLAYQRGWKNNQMVPAYLREQMQLDAKPAIDVRDDRVKAAFAMAPGDIQGFGMDEAGLRQMSIPSYIIVGAADTATPPKENAEFAAKLSRMPSSMCFPVRLGTKYSTTSAIRWDGTIILMLVSMPPVWIGRNCTSTLGTLRCSSSMRI
jgi:predicted dienelactone hydrolase